MTADEFLKNRDLIGAMVTFTESGSTYRGPISEIYQRRKIIKIKMRWMEMPDDQNKFWKRSKTTPPVISIAKDFFSCSTNPNGQLEISIPYLGSGKITKLANLSPQMQAHMKEQ